MLNVDILSFEVYLKIKRNYDYFSPIGETIVIQTKQKGLQEVLIAAIKRATNEKHWLVL